MFARPIPSRRARQRGVVASFVLAVLLSAAFLPAQPGFARVLNSGHVDQPAVVELFTSQGCSTCPTADRLVGDLSERADVIALSLHVNYWDYIGWTDPFGSARHTERQQAYVRRLNARYVYTPQIVVDGREQMVGTHTEEVKDAIVRARERGKPLTPRFTVSPGEPGMDVVIPAARTGGTATVWLAFYNEKLTTAVPRGENAGRTLATYNVVRELRPLATYTGERLTLHLDTDAAMAEGWGGCAILVQRGTTGPILGAVAMPLDTGS